MKTTFKQSFIFCLVLIVFIACEKSDPVQDEPGKLILRKKSAEIIKVNQDFAFELFREVYSLSSKENIMISPLSVSYALGMTYNGAAGTTKEAFKNVLHFGELTDQEVNESYQDLMDQLIHLDKQVQFSIANSIWYKMGFQVLQEFITTNKTYFDAAVRELDFYDPASVDIINGWIEDKTNDKIKDMLDQIPSNALMYLINAIYFNAKWKYEFDKTQTQAGTFYLDDGTSTQAEFMKVTGNFNYRATADFTAIELPYGDSTFSMLVLLPEGGKKVSGLVSMMDTSDYSTWTGSLKPAGLQIMLPKFKYSYGGVNELLNDPLISLGLGIAFDDLSADFSRISTLPGLYISRVIHQTFIDVQEEGTEAAAATIVEIYEKNGNPQPLLLRIDRPFLYLIKENSSGAIMFMGKVGRPEYL